MPTDFRFDVFLSHNSADKNRVHRLAERLRAVGVRVWLDAWVIKPGDDIYLAIERGLTESRTLILCLSPAALKSNWVGLERSTVLFRDPGNAERRFVPLLLADCEIPETLRRYRYVDYRKSTSSSFKELLTACRTEAEENDAEIQHDGKTEAPSASPTPPEREFQGNHWVEHVRFQPDGNAFAVTERGFVRTVNLETGETDRDFGELRSPYLKSIDFTPDGEKLLVTNSLYNSIRVWNLPDGTSFDLRGHKGEVWAVVALSDSRTAVSGSWDRTIKIWDLADKACVRTIKGIKNDIFSLAITPDQKNVFCGERDGTVSLWDLDKGRRLFSRKIHAGIVTSVLVTPDGLCGISASGDATIQIWNPSNGRRIALLEGHSSTVHNVALSPDGRLLASAGFLDYTVRVWDRPSGACLQVLQMEQPHAASHVEFSPDSSRLIVGTVTGRLRVYKINATSTLVTEARRYVNAKVVLVGESGVGKSSLAHRLIEDQFVQTPSTHGMQVWRLNLPVDPNTEMEREALLWDLAGQEDYRLIHQLFLDETALALLLFNPQEDDPFGEIGVWLKVLRAAVPDDGTREVVKLLIAARMDVGGVKVSQQKIDRFLSASRIAAYLPTSALRGDNCSDEQASSRTSPLKELIAHYIQWDKLPWTSTPRLLTGLKDALIALTEQRNIRLLRFAELAQRLEQALSGERFSESDVRTAVTLLANHGLVLPFKFGDLVLLRPELLNGYAAAVIRAARDHTDEIGCVKEQSVFDRTIDLVGVDRLDPADEELLMRALVQTFLDRSLCIAEDTPEGRHLVFPSQYRQERPIPAHPEIFVSYTFSGEWQTVYTTLVVRLWYSREFQHRELWRNAAEFETSKGRTVGLLMERAGEGEGTISVFFDIGVPDELKVIFIEYVHRHLEKHAGDVRRDRRYVCPTCAKAVTDLEAVRERLAAAKDFIYCQKCDERVPLIDHIEQRIASDPVARRVLGMDQRATRELDTQALEQILTGHMMAICGEANQIFREVTKFDYGIDGEVEFKDNDGVASGRKIYVQLKSGASYLRTRKADGKEVFDVKNPRHLEYWVSQPADVYLVIRDAEETIRWMNVTNYLKERPEKQSRQIVFAGEKLDAPAVWRVRDKFFR